MSADPKTHLDERLLHLVQELAETRLDLEREQQRRVEAEALLDEVAGTMGEGLVLIDAGGRVSRVNEEASRLLRRDREALVGSRARDVLGADVPVSPWEVFELDPVGRAGPLEIALSVDGRTLPVSLSCAVIRAASGAARGVLCVLRDLTQSRRLQRQLEKAETRWRLLADIGDLLGREVNARDALPRVCRRVFDATGCATAVLLVQNSVVERAFLRGGRPHSSEVLEALVGHPIQPGTSLAEVMEGGRIVQVPTLRPDFPLLAQPSRGGMGQSAALVPITGKGAPVGTLLLFSDAPSGVDQQALDVARMVAARVGLALSNARLRESLAELKRSREAARTRQEMLAGLSHDMKTPLTVIQGSLSTLQARGEEMPPEMRGKVLGAMSRQAQRLRSLVQQFLDYSRLEAGHPLAVHPKATDVAEVVERAVSTWKGTSPLEIEVAADVPHALADPERLEHVLANLLSNAFKFSPPNAPVAISVRYGESSVEVSVTDRGFGIDPRELPTLFDKFHRGPSSRGTEGTGLGLYISKAYVEAQGGQLRVSSRIGEGSTFTVSLPAATAPRGEPGPGRRSGPREAHPEPEAS